MSRIAGVWTPTSEIVGPSPEVSVYAGAMQAMPMIAPPIAPTFPAESPFALSPESVSMWRSGAGVAEVIGSSNQIRGAE